MVTKTCFPTYLKIDIKIHYNIYTFSIRLSMKIFLFLAKGFLSLVFEHMFCLSYLIIISIADTYTAFMIDYHSFILYLEQKLWLPLYLPHPINPVFPLYAKKGFPILKRQKNHFTS